MEQKKILWVVVFVSAFILIIFGAALYLYAPFRNKSTMNTSEIADLGRIQTDSEKTDIDPVQWSRDPSSIPPLETETSPPVNIINNNYTYVNGEAQSSKEDGSVNVSSLTDTEKPERETAALPESLAKEINQAAGNASAEKKEADLTVKKAATGVTAKKGTLAISEKKAADKTKQTVKQNTQNKLPSKSVTKTSKTQNTLSKKTVETIYWVQTASLTSRINAENARDTLTAKHMNAEIFTKETATGITHRVRVGPFKNKTEADYWLKRVREIKGFEGSYVSQDRKKE